MYKKLIIFSLLLILTTVTGCAGKKAVLRKPQITIANYTPLTIYKVFVTECKDREKFKNTPYSGTLLVENIHTNEFIVKEYRAQCVDITAYDKDGFVVGRQVNVSIPPNLVWKIRN